MRVIFFGSGAFAVPVLHALTGEHEVCLTICPPARPAGRKMCLTSSPLALTAQQWSLPLVEGLAGDDLTQKIHAMAPEALIVCDYGGLLPAAVLSLPPRGGLNVHPSLLPRWRGAAPIERAILAGDQETGVTIMQMDAGLDCGDILLQEKILLTPNINAGELSDILSAMSARLLLRALREKPPPTPQDSSQATYARKIHAAERRLNFTNSAAEEARRVRAFAPHPGAYTILAGERIKVCAARCQNTQGTAGEILSADQNGIVIACRHGALALTEIGREGKKIMTAADFLRGFSLPLRAYTE